ncbi:MAG: hypothetical protein ABI723_06135 [Bacteroidia bacterium]
MKNIDLVSTSYLDKLRLQIFFSDSSTQIIDFKSFFIKNSHFKKFSNINSFKKFKIEEGLLVWGDNWELVFPNHSLHQGTTDNYNEDDGLIDVYIVS